MANSLTRRFIRWMHNRKWCYGYVYNDDGTRRNIARVKRGTRNIYFRLWNTGQHGHKRKYWYPMGCGWITSFKEGL
jgi:hypothetical protein